MVARSASTKYPGFEAHIAHQGGACEGKASTRAWVYDFFVVNILKCINVKQWTVVYLICVDTPRQHNFSDEKYVGVLGKW